MADDILIAMIIAGFALSGAYLRAVFVSWRRNQATAKKREISRRELHADRSFVPEEQRIAERRKEIV